MDGGQPERRDDRATHDVRILLAERERELAKLRRELAHAQRLDAVGRVALGAMHEFNNALTCVLSFNQLAELAPERADCHREISNATLRAARLARQMLALGRNAASQPEDLDPRAALHEIHETIARSLGPSISTETRFEATGTIHIDPVELGQILLNLATNARDAIDGEGTIRFESGDVELGTAQALSLGVTPGHYVSIDVVDEGSGIEPELLPTVFESFVTTKSRESGTGLGLALSRRIATENGGTVTLHSRPGQGTTATLWLPRTRGEQVKPTPRTEEVPRVAGRILLIEPDAEVRNAVMGVLENSNCSVVAASPRDAERLRGIEFDAVLTGTGSRLHVSAALDAEPTGHVDKPCAPDQIARLIAASIRTT
ncbi:MAG: hypothetical protein KDB80_14070 [Planctomycetes bacterium]|nr:hypothetical protein [Planctomycetota bacterium]